MKTIFTIAIWLVTALAHAQGIDAPVQPTPAASPAPLFTLGVYGGPMTIVNGTEHKELIFARVSLNAHFSPRDHVGLRVDMARAQDGGAIATTVLPGVGEVPDPRTFRDIEAHLGYTHVLAPIPNTGWYCGPELVGGTTFSIEGTEGAPIEPRLWDAGGGIRCGDAAGNSSVHVLGGRRDLVGPGFKVYVSATVKTYKDVYLIAQGVPFGDHQVYMFGAIVGRQGGL